MTFGGSSGGAVDGTDHNEGFNWTFLLIPEK